MKANLGDEVKDKVTGLVGVVTAHAKHLYGCDRVFVQPPIGSDGKIPDGWWVDIMSVEVKKAAKVKSENTEQPRAERKTGGPMSRVR